MEPREASFHWLRRSYGSRLQLRLQLHTWSTCIFNPLAGLRLELALEPAVEICQRGPKTKTTSILDKLLRKRNYEEINCLITVMQ